MFLRKFEKISFFLTFFQNLKGNNKFISYIVSEGKKLPSKKKTGGVNLKY